MYRVAWPFHSYLISIGLRILFCEIKKWYFISKAHMQSCVLRGHHYIHMLQVYKKCKLFTITSII